MISLIFQIENFFWFGKMQHAKPNQNLGWQNTSTSSRVSFGSFYHRSDKLIRENILLSSPSFWFKLNFNYILPGLVAKER